MSAKPDVKLIDSQEVNMSIPLNVIPEILEVAPNLYLTLDGTWLAEPLPGARVIRGLDLPAPDLDIKQQLLSGGGDDLKQDIIDTLGLWGDTKDLFVTAWAIGSWVYWAYNTYNWVLKQMSPDPVEKALKKISDKLNAMNEVLNKHFEYVKSKDKSELDGILDLVEQYTKDFLSTQKPEDRQKLEDNLELLHVKAKHLLGPLYSTDTMQEHFYLPSYYPKEWATTLIFSGWWYEFNFIFQDPAVLLLGTGYPTMRWDYRGWLPLLARTLSLLIIGHKTLNPATRTAGKYRMQFQKYADGLRQQARRIAASIQMTRQIDLQIDGDYDFIENSWSFDILADGWPVGAVDTISGASVFDPRWKPAENGYPILAGVKGKKFSSWSSLQPLQPSSQYPAPNYAGPYFMARAKANELRGKAWWQVFAAHPAISKLFAFADLFEQLATPPTESETVTFAGPEWFGKRLPAGSEKVTVGGVFCDEKEFTAEVYHVERSGQVTVTVQPDIFKKSSHEIKYKFFLESYPHWVTSPEPLWRTDRKEIDKDSDSIYLQVSTFNWDIEKPYHISDQLQADNHLVYVMKHPAPTDYAYKWYMPPPTVNVGTQPMISQMEIPGGGIIADMPIEERYGTATLGPIKHLPFHYERTIEDGKVTITIENTTQNIGNAVLWLVVEEEVGFAGNPPPVIRSGRRLAMIGVERYLSPAYFAYIKYCNKKASESLREATKYALERGESVPVPDPTLYDSFIDYVVRVKQQMKRG